MLGWYSQISSDDGLVYEIKVIFRHILANLIIRLKQVDINYFATYKLNTILANHINDFYFCHEDYLHSQQKDLQDLNEKQRITIQHELLKNIITRNESQTGEGGHFALASRHHELVYLRQMSKKILPFILPNHIVKCRISMELIEEIFVNKLLLKGLDILAEPYTINKILIKIFEANEHSLKPQQTNLDDQAQVQILKHWCLMNGCIFKTIKAPTLKEIFDDNMILHHFIGYMNSVNSISILQLYLNLRDIIRSHTNELSSSCHSNCSVVSSSSANQIEELKTWCQNPKNNQTLCTIAYNSEKNLLQMINETLFKESTETDEDDKYKALEKIHDEIYSLIKEIYYSSFIKSDFMYKNLMGLNKLMPKIKASVRNSETTSLNSMNQAEVRSENNLVFDQDLDQDYEDFTGQIYKNLNDTIDSLNDDEEQEDDVNDLQIRLDLMNEIKDEIMEDKIETRLCAEAKENDDFEEEDDEKDVQDEPEGNDLNLSNLRMCVDDIEELKDKSNKNCFVFVIQVK